MRQPYQPDAVTKAKFADNSLLILPSQDSDLEGIIEMQYVIYNELCPRLTAWYQRHPEAFETEFHGPKGQDPGKRVFYSIKDSESRIVGCGGLVQKNPMNEPAIAELTDIYLLGEFRGKGLGECLVRDLIGKARVIGFESIFLTTRTEFVAATHLYQKLGFVQIPNEKYKSSNSTAWLLELK